MPKKIKRSDEGEESGGDEGGGDDEDEEEEGLAVHRSYLQTQLDNAMSLYDTMRTYGVTSISHLEVKISQLREQLKVV